MTDALDYCHIVADEEDGDAQVALQREHEVQHLRLHADVERAHGFVGDYQFRVQRQGAGDGDALVLIIIFDKTKPWKVARALGGG